MGDRMGGERNAPGMVQERGPCRGSLLAHSIPARRAGRGGSRRENRAASRILMIGAAAGGCYSKRLSVLRKE